MTAHVTAPQLALFDGVRQCLKCDERAVRGKARCEKHLSLHREKARAWRKANPDKVREYARRTKDKTGGERERTLARARYARDPSSKLASARRWRAENPGKKIDAYRVFKYGLRRGQFAEMVAAQRGLCAICGNPETARANTGGPLKSLAVDHCHATGRVRELLCARCNSILGLARDDIERLAGAIAYLRKHGEK